MKKTLIILNLLTVGVMLLFATGCGGGNESAGGQSTTAETKDASESVGTIDTTVTASPRSKSEFLQLANGLCRRATANQLTEVLQYAKEHEDEGLPEAELGVKAYRNAAPPNFPLGSKKSARSAHRRATKSRSKRFWTPSCASSTPLTGLCSGNCTARAKSPFVTA